MQKAISIIDSELVLLETKLAHPEQFVKDQIFKSDLHIIPKSKDLGIVALAEIVESLYLSKEVLNNNGKPASKSQIGNKFELIFNVSFGDISDKTSEIYKRKPFNRTKALDFLRNMIIRKDKETR
ncbi:RteC domain-containing protein [Dysgonomonas sp. BGC7]|uniref:RteC domain-containing protein n=1 Tax=Dysgonomonas sp. BGC7 TaxID=1658008 RepID=UPI000B013621|nr:RteC domain-containing protein [Dysgonomonas sp. BGC7]